MCRRLMITEAAAPGAGEALGCAIITTGICSGVDVDLV